MSFVVDELSQLSTSSITLARSSFLLEVRELASSSLVTLGKPVEDEFGRWIESFRSFFGYMHLYPFL
jgi:hypothetical protein